MVSDSRAIELSGTFTTEAMRWPASFAPRKAASVSAVSPDCETKSASPPSG
jgi:hypothetical protein